MDRGKVQHCPRTAERRKVARSGGKGERKGFPYLGLRAAELGLGLVSVSHVRPVEAGRGGVEGACSSFSLDEKAEKSWRINYFFKQLTKKYKGTFRPLVTIH